VQQTTRVLKDLVFVQTLKEKKDEIFEDSQMSEQRQILSILILISLARLHLANTPRTHMLSHVMFAPSAAAAAATHTGGALRHVFQLDTPDATNGQKILCKTWPRTTATTTKRQRTRGLPRSTQSTVSQNG
jgi:hypothetical protein